MDIHTIELDNAQYVDFLIKYLGVLQEGRIKPNNSKDISAESTVRDSIDNLKDIHGVKDRLNFIFKVDIINNIDRNNIK